MTPKYSFLAVENNLLCELLIISSSLVGHITGTAVGVSFLSSPHPQEVVS